MCPIGRKTHHGKPEYVAGGNTAAAPGTSIPAQTAGAPGQPAIRNDLPGPAPNTAGPHRHDVLNKLDPTVDSQSGGAQVLGPGAQTTRQAYAPGHAQGMGNTVPGSNAHGVASHNAAYNAPPPNVASTAPVGNVPEGTYGPHSSRMANTLDPRVDSDLDSTGAAYTHGRQPAMAQGGAPVSHTRGEMYGTQQTRPANTLDPRVDLDPNIRGAATADGRTPRAVHVGGTQPGPAPNTAGPHRSDFMNKLDPNVDSKRYI